MVLYVRPKPICLVTRAPATITGHMSTRGYITPHSTAPSRRPPHVSGTPVGLAQQVKQRQALDAELQALGRDPQGVGILWQTPIAIRETAREANAHRNLLLTSLNEEGVAVYLSYHAGYDFSTLPARFTLGELRVAIAATNASPMKARCIRRSMTYRKQTSCQVKLRIGGRAL